MSNRAPAFLTRSMVQISPSRGPAFAPVRPAGQVAPTCPAGASWDATTYSCSDGSFGTCPPGQEVNSIGRCVASGSDSGGAASSTYPFGGSNPTPVDQAAAERENARIIAGIAAGGVALTQIATVAVAAINNGGQTERLRIQAETNTAVARLRAMNGGLIPTTGQGATDYATLMAIQNAINNANAGNSSDTIMYAGIGLAAAAAIGLAIYFGKKGHSGHARSNPMRSAWDAPLNNPMTGAWDAPLNNPVITRNGKKRYVAKAA